jgi:signal transduction histidine kinase/putative methionine-R-sulfoxide reductase with GAF domain
MTMAAMPGNQYEQRNMYARQLERLQIVNEIALVVNRLDLDQILEVVYQRLHKLMGTRHFFVGLYDEPTHQLTLRGIYDDGKPLPNRVVALGDEPSFSAWVIEQRETLTLNSVDTHRLPDHIKPYGERTRSCVFVPLQVYDTIVGVFSVQSKTESVFETDDVSMLEAIAAQVAVAIYNAKLHGDTQRRLSEVSALHRLAEQLANINDPQQVCQTLVDEVHRIFMASVSALVWADTSVPYINAFAPASQPAPELDTSAMAALFDGTTAVTIYNATEQNIAAPTAHVAFMSVPLVVDKTISGHLLLASTAPNHFSAAQTDLLKIAATNGAAAIRNSQLLQETQQRAADLEAAYAELQDLHKLRQEVVENVSHELRSPLSYARAYIGLMSLGELGEINKQQEEALRIIDRKTNNMLRLINDILEAEKIRPETLHRQPEAIDTVIKQSFQSARLAYMTGRVGIELACDPPPVSLNIDALRIEQVLSNLISNAVKFSPENGVVTIDCHHTDDLFWIEVHDQGPGIPADKLEQIFERFYRVPGVKVEGIGIGLSIVKQIMNAHGGRIAVRSDPSSGTCFAVGLPKA